MKDNQFSFMATCLLSIMSSISPYKYVSFVLGALAIVYCCIFVGETIKDLREHL